MSPEQAEGIQISTRWFTDVYSLGVLLYELLSVRRPLIAKNQMSRQRRTPADNPRSEPPSPGARLSRLGGTGLPNSTQRQAIWRLWDDSFLAELEWIPLKAMRKEPRDRRYASAQSLAQDIQNYLGDLPLTAGPESRIYRFKKSLRRHAHLAIAVASIILVFALEFSDTDSDHSRQTRHKNRAEF